MNNIIRLFYNKQTTETLWRTTALYERKEYKHKTLNRFCRWLIDHLPFLVPHQEPYTAYKYLTIDTNRIGDMIVGQLDMWHRSREVMPKYVFMGREEFRKLSGESPDDHFRFHADINNISTYPGRRLYLGLEVIIVPWLEGVLVMPDVENWRG